MIEALDAFREGKTLARRAQHAALLDDLEAVRERLLDKNGYVHAASASLPQREHGLPRCRKTPHGQSPIRRPTKR